MTTQTKFLYKLSTGIEKSRVVFIQESSNCRGKKLLQSLIKSWSSIPGSINYLLLLQGCPKDYQQYKVTIVDVLGQFSDITREQNYTNEIRNQLSNLNGGKLFIDSIDPLIVGGESGQLQELFNWLSSKFDSIVTLSNGSLTSEVLEHKLRRTSTTWIEINDVNEDKSLYLKIANKKKHRRVDFIIEFYEETIFIDTNLVINTINAVKPKDTSSDPSGDVLPDVTFNLNLKDDEREAKESLVLPYIKNRRSSGQSINDGTSSKVFYYPDQNDDVDEDDPDDDLGI